MDTWSKELKGEGLFEKEIFWKPDPDQIYHHEGQRGEPPQKQAIQNQHQLAFSRSTSTEPRRSIYSVKTWDYTAPTSWTEGSLLFTNKEDRPATKMDYRLTAEVTESTPWATPRDCCHSRGPSHRYTCCYTSQVEIAQRHITKWTRTPREDGGKAMRTGQYVWYQAEYIYIGILAKSWYLKMSQQGICH